MQSHHNSGPRLAVKATAYAFTILILLTGLLVADTAQVFAATAGDDYPASVSNCRPVSRPGQRTTCNLRGSAMDNYYDPWGELNRECTSAVAWWLHERNGFEMPFNDNADGWKDDAAGLNYSVNGTPSAGSVAWWSSGHVAYVTAASGDGSAVDIDEYNNPAGSGSYNHRSLANDIGDWPDAFIHFKDSGPALRWGGVGDAKYKGTGLITGRSLAVGEYVVSGNVQHVLILQADGNLVLYHNGAALWNTHTAGSSANHLVMQTDGNLVLYKPNGVPVWDSNTDGNGWSYLVMQDDGNLVTYKLKDGRASWNSHTAGYATYSYYSFENLSNGQSLPSGYYLNSMDGHYALLLQEDGNLVLYGPGYNVLWSSGTAGSGSNRLVMQGDGNLVLYQDGTAKWNTETDGNGSSYLDLQTDGNLVIYRNQDGRHTWATSTQGEI